ncbi:MAG: ferric reductase-like transmembrane domain-containing protein [Dehalococcoidia bacterium]|nr:ferric reductase-like transmembrane domain-containing protein [Dehalococcoidia bacterium]
MNSAGQLQIDLAGQFPPASASPSGVDSTGQPATSQPATSQPAAGQPTTGQPTTGQPVDHTYWYLSRATGFTAYVLLFLDVCLGLAASGRLLSSLLARWQTFDLHQVTGLLSMMFLALHMFALLGDRYVGFDLAQLLVPFASPYRWLWTALGVISFYLLGAVIVSSYLRKYVSSRAWKAIHYSSFAVFLLALAHSILAGTDTATPWGVLLYVGTGTAVLVLLLARVSRPSLSALAKNTAGDPA